MYNDYPTAYETVINNNIIYMTIVSIFLLLIIIFTFISLGKIYKKANRSAISAWVPIYNKLVLLEIVNLPKWYIILLLIPIVNIFINIKIYFTLAKLFRRSKSFALGMLFLPFIFYPILAFSSSEYVGINLMAMEGKTQAVDIPVMINEQDQNPTIHEERDIKSENIGISIGGGVYQKDYTNTLLQVDENQEIMKKPNLIDNRKKPPVLDPTKASFITQIEEEPVKEEETSPSQTVGISFPEPLSKIEPNPLPIEKITIPEPSPTISTNQINYEQEPIFKQTEDNTTNNETITPEISEPGFVTCPKCGAKVKSDAKACFLCGTKLN